MILTVKPEAFLVAWVFALSPQIVLATEHTHLGWDLQADALMSAQSPQDVEMLAQTIEKTKNLAHAVAKYASDSKVAAAAMIRFRYGGERTYLLYRTDDKAVIADVYMDRQGRVRTDAYAEVPPVEWNTLFNKFRDYQQQEPTPLTRNNPVWSHGYRGVAHVYEKGSSRAYLITAKDIEAVHIPGTINDFLCKTIYSGLHCRPGPHEYEGWVIKELSALQRSAIEKRNAGEMLGLTQEADSACEEAK